MPQNTDKKVLVGYDTSDDAGVYLLNDEQALIMTADFITPPVDDPFVYGQIAAANSISDVYAMGGKPQTCLNVVGYPAGKLDQDVLKKIIVGALNKITEAGAILMGGHTTDDKEPKFGLSVNGMVHPKKIWRNRGAQPGDQLILTKPIGSGVLFNANIKNKVSKKAMQECIDVLIELNKSAAEVFWNYEIHAATDITGFGFAGHAVEMIGRSGNTFHIKIKDLPVMNEALEMYQQGVSTGVNASNQKQAESYCHFDDSVSKYEKELMYDPQTSGGLLVSVSGEKADSILEDLHKAGVTDAKKVGYVTTFEKADICFS